MLDRRESGFVWIFGGTTFRSLLRHVVQSHTARSQTPSMRLFKLDHYRVVAQRGIEPRDRHSLNLLYRQTPRRTGLLRRTLVGPVGLEPTESLRSERSAFADLTTARTGGVGAIRTHTAQALNLLTLPIGLRRREWWACSDSNRDAHEGATCFEHAVYTVSATGPKWRKATESNRVSLVAVLFSRQSDAIVHAFLRLRCRNGEQKRRVRTTAGSGNSSVIAREVVTRGTSQGRVYYKMAAAVGLEPT